MNSPALTLSLPEEPGASSVAWFSAVAIGVVLTLPWLNPFASGPLPPTMQTLLTGACLASALGLGLAWIGVRQLARLFAGAWLIAALASAVIALIQYFGVSADFEPWINITRLGEAYGNLRQRNQLATLMNIGLLALLYLGQAHQPQMLIKPGRFALFFGAFVLTLGNVVSSSRTGTVQLGVIFALLLMWRAHKNAVVLSMMAGSAFAFVSGSLFLPWAAGLGFAGAGILNRLTAPVPACNSRITLWSNVLDLISLKPWTGWGWGELSFAHFVTRYPGLRFCEILDNAHNLPLHLAVELGVPVALALFCALIWLVWRSKPWAEGNAARQMAWAVLAMILLHSLLEYPLWYGPFQLATLSCIWLLWRTRALNYLHRSMPPTGNRPTSRAPVSRPTNGPQTLQNTRGTPTPLPISARKSVGDAPVTTTSANAAAAALAGEHPNASVSQTRRFLELGFALILMAGCAYAAWDYWRISQIYLPLEQRSPDYRGDTLGKIKGSWLFRNQVAFAKLTTTDVNAENAPRMYRLSSTLMHFSPESRVVQKLIESSARLGKLEEVAAYRERFAVVYPADYAAWVAINP